MGLSENSKYTSTKHFRDRLFERYGVPDSQWRPHMARMYGNLKLDNEKTAQCQQLPGAKNRQIYYSEKDSTYVVVDPTNHKLITIFDNPDTMENAILGGISTIEDAVLNDIKAPIDTPNDTTPDVEPNTPESSVEESTEGLKPDTDALTVFADTLRKERDEFNKKLHYRYAQRVIQHNQELFDTFIHAYQRVVNGNASKINQEHLNTLRTTKLELDNIFQLLDFEKDS